MVLHFCFKIHGCELVTVALAFVSHSLELFLGVWGVVGAWLQWCVVVSQVMGPA